MRIGACGTGTVASWISGILNKLGDSGIELYGCATSPGFDCSEFAEKFGYKKVYAGFDELLADENVDIAYIAVPNNFHYDLCRKAIAAGKNIICEKPFGINEKEDREIMELAEKKGIFIMEGLWASFLPVKAMVRKELDDGIIGEVTGGHVLDINNQLFLKRLLDLELGGGYLLDTGPYTIGWMVDYFGTEIENVDAKMRMLESGVDAEDWISVTYKNGCRVNIRQAMDADEGFFEEYAVIEGTKGRVYFDRIANPHTVVFYDENGKVIKQLDIPLQIVNPGMPPVSGYEHEFIGAKNALKAGLKEVPEAAHSKTLAIAHVMTQARRQNGLTFPFEYRSDHDLLIKDAEAGNAKAQSMLGEDYIHGNFAAADYAMALKWCLRAASQGDSRASTNLGVLYMYGNGVEKDEGRAAEYLTAASDSGDFKAPRYLGIMYEDKQDYAAALKWYQLAAERGDITGQFLLGQMYEKGLGTQADIDTAVQWYRKSARRKDKIAQPAIDALKRLGVK